MQFSSIEFLWVFFPLVFVSYHMIGKRYKNICLLFFSLLFYACGEPKYIFLMFLSIVVNYIFGILIDKSTKKKQASILLVLCLLINFGLLGYFKYFNFLADIANEMSGRQLIPIRNIALPIGISFYTFQVLSYVIDVYRKDIKVQKNFLNLALYVSFFPQLIAGPIVKYHDIENQMEQRTITIDNITYGIKRFVLGLGKKIIFANAFASVVDEIFRLSPADLDAPLIWLGIFLYALQIYYDFSGYSDMAIGLGKMFGFDFLENFNYPYISTSIQDFWRRWHMSLSTWFREYLYIPLGGNRKGTVRTYINLIIVFFVTGLWHGASANYIIWGLYHGFFLVLERMYLGKWLEKNPFKIFNHIYTIIVVLIGWLIFRIESVASINILLKQMLAWSSGPYTIPMFVDNRIMILLIAGVLCCGLLQTVFKKLKVILYTENKIYTSDIVIMVFVLLYSSMLLISGTYNPFIYFRF